MDKDDKSPGAAAMIAVAMLAAGIFFVARPPLDSSRPAMAERQALLAAPRETMHRVDARLWQDPFSAVARARVAALKTSDGREQDARHDAAWFKKQLTHLAKEGGESGAVVLAVTLPAGPHAEQAEGRRRTRYAVLAALSARGFVPADGEHLSYFHTQVQAAPATPTTVVFESFLTQFGMRDRRDDCNDCRLVVLWLDSSAFEERPLDRLVNLAEQVAPTPEAGARPQRVRWRVLGPSTSDGLRALVKEAALGSAPARELLNRHDLSLFSAAATAPDAVLLAGLQASPTETVASFLERRDVTLLRTIGTDDAMARALVRELELRGLRARPSSGLAARCPRDDRSEGAGHSPKDLPSSIAIVSEWDTLYGRSLRRQFRYDPSVDKPGFCVTRWHYLRGLDGRLPGDTATTAASGHGGKQKDEQAESAEQSYRDRRPLERPQGQSQYDYLRRLAVEIRQEDARLRHTYGREYGIRAIGVLGKDVYDKLLVLQALQPEMPHAIFFTTDLDARLLHPREQAWARNLIVASSFGLRLAEPLQHGYAAFRDSSQPATFLAALLALADVGQAIEGRAPKGPRWTQERINPWFEHPRMFEVSRTGAFDFSTVPEAAAAMGASARAAATLATQEVQPGGGTGAALCGRWRLEKCAAVHPPGSPMVPPLALPARFLIAALLLALLWLPVWLLGRGVRRQLRRFVAPLGWAPRWARVLMLVLALVGLTVVLPLLLALAWPGLAQAITHNGKPLTATDGISPWPTYALRMTGLVICVLFVLRACSLLADNLDDVALQFRLGATRRALNDSLSDEERKAPWRQRLWAMLSVRFFRERPPMPGAAAVMSGPARNFWKHYIAQNRTGARLLRTTLCVVLTLVAAWLIESAMGDAPVAPQRGELTRAMQMWSNLPAILAVQFLIFFVADATLLNVLFMRGLRLHSSTWPERTLRLFKERMGVPEGHLDDWIDLRFIARRTRSIGTLIYFPFVVLSLLLLARSTFFDDWYSPPSLVLLTTLSFAVVVLCAFALRHEAEASRRHALWRLRDSIMHAQGEGHTGLAAQLGTLQERIESLREGAFARYTQQPLLKALLLPLLTVGGGSLYDYLLLAKL